MRSPGITYHDFKFSVKPQYDMKSSFESTVAALKKREVRLKESKGEMSVAKTPIEYIASVIFSRPKNESMCSNCRL